MMFYDPDVPLFDETEDDPWDAIELRTADRRRIEVSDNRETGEYFTVERPTVGALPATTRP